MKTLFFIIIFLPTLLLSQTATNYLQTSKHDKLYYQKDKGYFGRAEGDVNPLLLFSGDLNLHIINGYKVNQYFQIGIASGMHFNYIALSRPMQYILDTISGSFVELKDNSKSSWLNKPIGIYLRSEIGKGRCKFYISSESGYYLPINYKKNEQFLISPLESTSNKAAIQVDNFSQFYINPSMGISIPTKTRINYSLGIDANFIFRSGESYQFYNNKVYNYNKVKFGNTIPTFGFKFGVGW